MRVFFLSYRDADGDAKPAWLFQTDVIDSIRVAFGGETGYPPIPDMIEDPVVPYPSGRHPAVTGYRFAVTTAAIVFGTTKVCLVYFGQATAPRAIEWIFGGAISLV